MSSVWRRIFYLGELLKLNRVAYYGKSNEARQQASQDGTVKLRKTCKNHETYRTKLMYEYKSFGSI